jgi:hypothetical protein
MNVDEIEPRTGPPMAKSDEKKKSIFFIFGVCKKTSITNSLFGLLFQLGWMTVATANTTLLQHDC